MTATLTRRAGAVALLAAATLALAGCDKDSEPANPSTPPLTTNSVSSVPPAADIPTQVCDLPEGAPQPPSGVACPTTDPSQLPPYGQGTVPPADPGTVVPETVDPGGDQPVDPDSENQVCDLPEGAPQPPAGAPCPGTPGGPPLQ